MQDGSASHFENSPGALMVEAITREVRRKLALETKPLSGALVIHLSEPSGPGQSYTLIVEQREVRLHRDGSGHPFLPTGHMGMAEPDLLALARGECSAVELMQEGRLELRGDADTLRMFGSYFQGGESWVSVRVNR